ncbi:MAG: carbamoyltransferase C-terminal domain-containing protein [Myxococcota bacterium]|nr:carbamoyltransferase C-terminal domain-containing protein [Myxococcota bacterium]
MRNILGFSLGHDGSVTAVKAGKPVCAISRERLTRTKHEQGVSEEQIHYVLDAADLSINDIGAVALCDYFPWEQTPLRLFDAKTHEPINTPLVSGSGDAPHCLYIAEILGRKIPAFVVTHHLAHAASAFYTSPFSQAACFTADASLSLPEHCSSFAYGIGHQLFQLYCPGFMLGNAYSNFTEFLGIGLGIEKAGSTMGLAPYGTVSEVAQKRWEEFGARYFQRNFETNDQSYIRYMWSQLAGLPPHQRLTKEESSGKVAQNIAASLQYIFERNLVKYGQELYRDTASYNQGNLCLAGGSFLNCNANMKIKEETSFERIHLFPACGDDGLCVGAALYTHHHILGNARETYKPREYMYLGKEHASDFKDGENYSPEKIAHLISEGGLVAWYQGKSEFGPRALGNRSLLGDPRRSNMREIINQKIKCREWFRPFAPVVLKEKAQDWFEMDFESPLMLFISQVKKPTKIPAVTHVDNSSRVQTIARSDNPRYYTLIEKFEEQTGVPILLNTSLNVNGEPIVETPKEAMRFFLNTKVDALVIGDQMWLAKQRSEIKEKTTAAA